MTDPIAEAFARVRTGEARPVIPFVCAGYPSIESTAAVLSALSEAGAPLIEVGIPFSDPIADGPVIAAAMHEALETGVTPESTLCSIHTALRAPAGPMPPIVAMVSVTLVRRPGTEAYVRRAAEAGVSGLIVPDAPLEESEELSQICTDAGLSLTLLVSPTTPDDRALRIARASTGFVYVLARTGITGAGGGGPDPRLAARIAMLRSEVGLPIGCGFGISSAEEVRWVVDEAGADAAIVGSALVKAMTGSGPEAVSAAVEKFLSMSGSGS